MKIDPSNLSVYTDEGEFLKVLHCPHKQKWQDMKPSGTKARLCEVCEHKVHDTSTMSDHDLVELMKTNPEACLMISPTQSNCTIIPIHERKTAT